MGKLQINANEVMKDVREGMNDSELMEKYHLSARGLESLFRKLVTSGLAGPDELTRRSCVTSSNGRSAADSRQKESVGIEPRSLQSRDVVKDVRGGMSDLGLMAKYKLNATALQSLFRKLISAGLVTQMELDGRPVRAEATADIFGEANGRQGARKEKPVRNGLAGERKCPSCGMPMSDVVQECLRCGFSEERFKAVQAKKQRSVEARWVCPSCNKPQTREFSVCPACGVNVSRLESKRRQEKESQKKLKRDEFRKSVQEARDIPLSKERSQNLMLILVILGVLAILVATYLYFYVSGQAHRSKKNEESRNKTHLIQTAASADLRAFKGLPGTEVTADSRNERIVLDTLAARHYYEKLRRIRAHSSAGRATGS